MKANEAPEKLYITYKGYGVFDEDSTVERTKDSQTEYTRTDAFIEDACEWIKEHKEVVETEDNGIMGWIPDYFIEEFRNYMEGE